jgi:hypothetical protein
MYIYLDNFVPDYIATKVTKHTGTYYPADWWGLCGPGNVWSGGCPSTHYWGGSVEGIILPNGSQDSFNFTGATIPQNQWACLETQEVMSTPGVNNGILRIWVNGTLLYENLATPGRAATFNQNNSPTATYDYIILYVQDGGCTDPLGTGACQTAVLTTLYLDEYAVSRDARIGCSGSAATAPPPAPTGLSVK